MEIIVFHKERLISWQTQLRGDSVSWLLKSDSPNVSYLAMRDLLDLPPEDKKLKAARKSAHKEGPIAHVLSKMKDDGYWQRAGTGYVRAERWMRN
jgi:hypothetical protein